MSHTQGIVSTNFNRALQQKIWPGIPNPEREFEGLFTTHKGNFQVGVLFALSAPAAACCHMLKPWPLSWLAGALFPAVAAAARWLSVVEPKQLLP